MLYFSFWPSGRGGGLREGLEDLRSRPHLVTEVLDVLTYREQISRILPRPLSGYLASTPLRSHAHYSRDRKSTRLNSSHVATSYAVFCLKTKNKFIEIDEDNTIRTGKAR